MMIRNSIAFGIYLAVSLIWAKGPNIYAQLIPNYYFHTDMVLTWYDAALFCQTRNMRTLSIESDEEFDYVRNYLNQNYGNSAQHFWTAGVDITPNSSVGDPGQIWPDLGTKIQPHYWGPEEPNDQAFRVHEMCVMILYYQNDTSFMINDAECSTALSGVICKELVPEPCDPQTTSAPCQECPTTEMPTTTTCSPVDCPACPSPSTCPLPETTTESGPGVFICENEGQFPDPLECHVFHVCIAYNGTFIDDEFNCPDNLVYCPEEEICDYNTICPCNLNLN